MSSVRIRHVAQINPQTPAFNGLSEEDSVTFLPMESIWSDSRLDLSVSRRKKNVEVGYTRFQNGDILLPKITPTFEADRTVLIDGLRLGVGAGTTEVHVVRPAPFVDPRFLTYVLKTDGFLKLGHAAMYGVAGQKRVPDAFVKDWMVSLPPLDEQRRIADFLDEETNRIDRLLSRLNRVGELLALKRGQVAEAEVQEMAAEGSCGELAPLKYLVESITVGIVVTPAKWYVESGGVPALRGVNVKPGKIDCSDLVEISIEGNFENRKSRLSAGDVVVVRTGQAGTAAVVPDGLEGGNCIDLIRIRPGRKVLPEYLECVLNLNSSREWVSENSVGTIQSHLNVSSIGQLLVPVLPCGLQKRVVIQLQEKTGVIDKLIRCISEQIDLLGERKRALITAAVTGEFDVSTASGRGTV